MSDSEDSEDQFDYLSALNGQPRSEEKSKPTKRPNYEVITVDDSSEESSNEEPVSDSDDCITIEDTDDDQEVYNEDKSSGHDCSPKVVTDKGDHRVIADENKDNNNTNGKEADKPTNGLQTKGDDVKTGTRGDVSSVKTSASEDSSSVSEVNGKEAKGLQIHGEDKDLASESKPVIKSESSDRKPIDLKPQPGSDIKTFDVKNEMHVKTELKKEVKPEGFLKQEIKGDIKSEKFANHLENNSNNNNNNTKCDTNTQRDALKHRPKESPSKSVSKDTVSGVSAIDDRDIVFLLNVIQRVRGQHQRPTFDRLLVSYKPLKICQQSGPISVLKSHIDAAIEKGIIKKIESDCGVSAYLPTATPSPRSSDKSTSNQTNPRISRDISNNESNDLNTPKTIPTVASNLNEIDVSDQFENSDSEISPQMFHSLTSTDTSTSFSMNSVPIKMCNHNNREVIRRQTAPSSANSRTDDQNWLLEPLPRYAPFIGQTNDRVIYLRDAHYIYLDYELKELEKLYPEFQCGLDQIDKAVGDKYLVKAVVSRVKFYQFQGIRFVVLRLQNMPDEPLFEFNLLYRPNRGICDFLVLEKLFNQSQLVEWNAGSVFRSLWKKSWWLGVVVKKSVFDKRYPLSPFKCYKVKWDTEEEGRLSPWDLFAVDESRLPKKKENGVVLNRDDLLEINYKPLACEWPEVDGLEFQRWRCYEAKRIYSAIKFIEAHVDDSVLNLFEQKSCENELAYPIDLKLIKNRLKNLFYRRKTAVVDDIEYLKANCRFTVKLKHLKYADDMLSLWLKNVEDNNAFNEHHFQTYLDQYPHLITGFEVKEKARKRSQSSETNPAKAPKAKKAKPNKKSDVQNASTSGINGVRRQSESQSSADVMFTESTDWKDALNKFIDELLKKDESLPYRRPVDPNEYPHYHTVITEPIALCDIQDKLNDNNYLNPKEVRQDFRLMYENAKAFTKDSKSLMRVNNKRLHSWSEDRLRNIITDWERVYKYEQKLKNTSNGAKPREPIPRDQLWGYGAQQYY